MKVASQLCSGDDPVANLAATRDLIAQAAAHEKNEAGEWSRRVTLWEEESGTMHGIRFGDQMHELSIRPDWFSDKPDMGDFMMIKNIYYP